MNKLNFNNTRKGFTLAEVLITLGIIGVVAAITMPIIVNKYQEQVYKTAYKKVYAELSEAVREAIFNQEFIRTERWQDAAAINELEIFKSKFKILKECSKSMPFDCWQKADYVCGDNCGAEIPSINRSSCFIDASGRNWCNFDSSENIYIVDTNGFKEPNKFGKDRWIFTFADQNGIKADSALNYRKIIPLKGDFLTGNVWCHYPPCYYHSWLYK